MKFNEAPDCKINNIFNRYVSEDGIFEIGIFPVMFGFRIRAGFVGEPGLECDYCCATDTDLLGRTLAVCIARLETIPDFSLENIRWALPEEKDKLFRDFDLQKELGLVVDIKDFLAKLSNADLLRFQRYLRELKPAAIADHKLAVQNEIVARQWTTPRQKDNHYNYE